eukprot:3533271-Pleurochrysis_carterae.AAC.1
MQAHAHMRKGTQTCASVTAHPHDHGHTHTHSRPQAPHARPAQVRDALFLVRLQECEGEFPLGLA